jgi:putative ABC transport system permease protein
MPTGVIDDLTYAWRSLRARPGFTLVALLTIGLGLGANTAIFGVVNTVYLRPLPFDAENRLMRVQEFSLAPDGTRRRVSALGATFELVRDHVHSFDAVVAQTGASFTLDAGGGAERVAATLVSAGWGGLLGLPPALGRHFSADEDRADDSRVVLIGHGLWQRHFGSRPETIGATLRLSGADYTVIGVMPPGFRYPYDAELWLPARFSPEQSLYVLARLAPGATLEQANAELSAISDRVAERFPHRAGMGVDAHSARTNIQQGEDRLAVALMGGVGFLLLIACANVAMLLTTRFASRQREVAVRAALGCGRTRQVRQFVTESLLLFTIGGVLGLLLTLWLKESLVLLVPRVLATQLAMGDVSVDGRVVAFGFVLALLAGLAFGIVAALRASSADLQGLMKQGGRSSTGGGGRTLNSLVVAEIALAVVLLTGAGSILTAFQRAQRGDLGFMPDGLLTFRLDLSQGGYAQGSARLDLISRLQQRLAALPGAVSAGAISVNPLCCGDWGARVVVEGQMPASAEATPVVFHRYVTPGALETMGVRLLAGRLFSSQDTQFSLPVVVVDEPFERRFFPNGTAIGGRVKRAPYDSPNPWLTVVGVVADVQEEGEYHEGWYLPYAQDPLGPSAQHAHMLVRSGGDPLALAGAVRHALTEIDPRVAPYAFTTMDQLRSEQLQQDRMGTVLILLFAGFGLLLAMLGVYGLTAFVVAQRTREIGVRLVLGATPSRVILQVLTAGLRLAAAGVVLGVGGALAATRVLASVLPEVGGANLLVVGGAAALLALVALAASAVPAARVIGLDPASVLRAE